MAHIQHLYNQQVNNQMIICTSKRCSIRWQASRCHTGNSLSNQLPSNFHPTSPLTTFPLTTTSSPRPPAYPALTTPTLPCQSTPPWRVPWPLPTANQKPTFPCQGSEST